MGPCATHGYPSSPMPAQHAETQNTPLKLRTTSVPTAGKVFNVEDVNQDLLVELEDATINEDSNAQPHCILDLWS